MINRLSLYGRFILALAGALLSLGAPLGWLVVQSIAGVEPRTVIQESPDLMLYLLLSTMVVFSITGFVLGLQWEKLHSAKAHLKTLASRDDLTGLLNVRRFWKDITRETRRSNRHQHSLYLMILDLDHFKRINDTYGHPVGDQVLRAVSQALSDQLRHEEYIYRVGGEEFAVLLTNLNNEEARGVANRLQRTVENLDIPLSRDSQSPRDLSSIGVTVSIGVAGSSSNSTTEPKRLYQLADKALYRAKEAGRNRVEFHPMADRKSRFSSVSFLFIDQSRSPFY